MLTFLEGFDKEWQYVGNQRSASYTNLNAGEYTFRVKASNNDGVWNEKGASVKVVILPPWYKTWWFRLLAFSAIAGSVYYYYRSKINRIEEQKKK